ncbi:MAG: 2-oxo acid dehydrogenase subunit E2 [Anaerolineales bacterium]|nr:2-oxo acid dehydrogenase subunit E2 [Anaerolineales bacterium]
MAEKVIMPKLEMAQETGKVIEWLKEEGEQVEKGEPLFVIETDKVTVEIESPGVGILAGVSAWPGDEVPISTVIAYLIEPGEEVPKVLEEVVEEEAVPELPPEQPVPASPVAQRLAAEYGIDLADVVGSGPKGQIRREDVESMLAAPEVLGIESLAGKVRATPAARRLARERGISLSMVQGTGPGGRIHAEDVLASDQVQVLRGPLPGEVIPLEGMRQTIAERMTMSFQTAPHISVTVRVDMGSLEEARRRINSEAQEKGVARVSVTTFIVMAAAWALRRHPWLNSTLREDGIHILPEINIGLAVAVDEGLIVPVVRHADRKSLAQISMEVNDLAERARASQLTPSDVSGSTFTISNLGPFGIEQFTAILNPPQTAILAVGAIQPEVLPDETGGIIVSPTTRMTLTADHRVLDGAVAARFLTDVKDALEKPWLLHW